MPRLLARSIAMLCAAQAVFAQPPSLPSERLLEPFGAARFSRLYRTAIDAFFTAQLAYRHHDYAAASGVLDALWRLYPPGQGAWVTAIRESEARARDFGVDFGTPPCYYALRMLTECVTWRLKGNTSAAGSAPIRMAVVLVGYSSGIQPTTKQELETGGGRPARNSLSPEMAANGHEVIEQASWLFREYVQAMTGGRLPVEVQYISLPELDVPVRMAPSPPRIPEKFSAGLAPGGLSRIWQAVGAERRSQIDWWWVLFPSHRPEDYPELSETDFFNGGGTTSGPDGRSFATFGDDLALLRKAPRYHKAPFLPEERTVYWSQVLQHEFFHHLLSSYPKFQLEAKDHQWFDRSTWPADFAGQLEPDYYAEALHKRLQQADPPLHVQLRYAVPADVRAKITLAMLAGAYRRVPVENGWHEGRISVVKTGLRWTNQANKTWELSPDLGRLVLGTGPDNPYARFGLDGGREFRIVLRRGPNGEYLPEVAGFEFLGDLYEKR